VELGGTGQADVAARQCAGDQQGAARSATWAVFLLRREGLVVRVVKDLRIEAREAAAESLVTPRRAITRRPATRHAGNT